MEHLLAGALACSFAGLVLLYFLSGSLEPAPIAISELESHYGETVKIRGIVERLSVSGNGTVFLRISDASGSAEVAVFGRQASKMPELASFKSGQNICIAGKVSSYKGKAELVGEKLC